MKTNSSPVPWPAKQPLVVGPRQLCMAFETPVLLAATSEQRATATQALAASGKVAEAQPFIEMVQKRGSPQEKEQLAAIFANAALPLIQKQPADFNGAADLTRQCISVADPAGKVVGSCHLILGISTFQAAVAMDGDTEKNKSCDGAKKEAELVAEAKTSLTEAGKARPDAVAQYVSAIPQFEARTASMIKAYCK